MFKPRKFRKEIYGSLSFFFIFIYLSVILLTLFAVAIPMMININTEFFEAGQDIIDMANDDFVIGDSEVAQAVADSMSDASDSTANQIVILSGFFQYSWVIIIVVVTLVIYIIARSTVEVNARVRLV